MSSTITVPAPAAIELPRLQTHHYPSDEERSHPSSPHEEPPEGAVVFTPPNVSSVKWQLLSMNFSIFLGGINDAATGALVPYLQPAYSVGLLFIAVVYLVNFLGWSIAALTNVHLTARLGTGGVMLLGGTLQLLAHALQFWKPPFALFVFTYLLAGLGIAYQDAQANSFVGGVHDAHRWLGVLHAVYGAGALVSPLIATKIASSTPHWNHFYLVAFGIALLNVALIATAFWGGIGKPPAGARDRATSDLKKTVSNRTVILISLFFFLYVGTEVTAGGIPPPTPPGPPLLTTSGWVVEFLIRERGGHASSVGYVASGFWGGLTLGRLLLADITFRLGERRMVFVYLVLSLAVQLTFWLVPNLLANAVMISLLGFFIGPFFPTGISVATKLLPKELHVPAIGFMSTTGQAGSAAFPFLTGAVAAKVGVGVLQPVLVALLAAQALLWAAVPRVSRRTV
ncbi:major facilitator superfamily domain-containing protein [Sphaerosporella brunnea]|uniref:Major facilitator superfamily domain-containing protein n=1 Tax=Sphaerosporella brunnea TaxID=1250544 RepID=A0A5J5F4U0_9PEZI|nr:major facilitator superfamily domain-containing protein [Sphaerosporella brunnea]